MIRFLCGRVCLLIFIAIPPFWYLLFPLLCSKGNIYLLPQTHRLKRSKLPYSFPLYPNDMEEEERSLLATHLQPFIWAVIWVSTCYIIVSFPHYLNRWTSISLLFTAGYGAFKTSTDMSPDDTLNEIYTRFILIGGSHILHMAYNSKGSNGGLKHVSFEFFPYVLPAWIFVLSVLDWTKILPCKSTSRNILHSCIEKEYQRTQLG